MTACKGEEHDFLFLRQIVEEATWHHFVAYDVFFCRRCLTQKKIVATVPEVRRW